MQHGVSRAVGGLAPALSQLAVCRPARSGCQALPASFTTKLPTVCWLCHITLSFPGMPPPRRSPHKRHSLHPRDTSRAASRQSSPEPRSLSQVDFWPGHQPDSICERPASAQSLSDEIYKERDRYYVEAYANMGMERSAQASSISTRSRRQWPMTKATTRRAGLSARFRGCC